MGSTVAFPIALFAEYRPRIGTGHIVEIKRISAGLTKHRISHLTFVSRKTPRVLLSDFKRPFRAIKNVTAKTLKSQVKGLKQQGVKVVLTNFWNLTSPQASALTPHFRVIAITEQNRFPRGLSAVIHPTLAPFRWTKAQGQQPTIYTGPRYMPLSPALARVAAQRRQFSGPIKSIVVSMGGRDRTAATLRVAQALSQWPSTAKRHIVVGGAASWGEELKRFISRHSKNWIIHERVTRLEPLFLKADVAFSAGGDTLLELACTGTPTLTLFEDPHEKILAEALQAKGFGKCLGSGLHTPIRTILTALARLENPAHRRQQSRAGKQILDGNGVERVCQIIAQEAAR